MAYIGERIRTTCLCAVLKIRTGVAPRSRTPLDRSIASRAVRAVLTTLGLWVIGAFMFFIPLAHFVLIPLFFFAGLVMGVTGPGPDRF